MSNIAAIPREKFIEGFLGITLRYGA